MIEELHNSIISHRWHKVKSVVKENMAEFNMEVDKLELEGWETIMFRMKEDQYFVALMGKGYDIDVYISSH